MYSNDIFRANISHTSFWHLHNFNVGPICGMSKIFLRRSLPPPPPNKLKICDETACESAGMQKLNT
jgi:hypothetical protein